MSQRKPAHENDSAELDTDTLPIILEDGDGHHRPHISIHHTECGNCGYDRSKVKRRHGEITEECMNCGAINHQGEWISQPNTNQHLAEMEKAAEKEDSPIVKYGEYYNSQHERYVIFGRETNTDLFKVFRSGELDVYCTTITGREFKHTLQAVYQNNIELLEEIIATEADSQTPLNETTKELTHSLNTPPNSNGIHASVLNKKGIKTREAIRLSRNLDTFPPIHITPDQ